LAPLVPSLHIYAFIHCINSCATQETKFKEATGFYEAIVKKNYDNVSKWGNSQKL